MLTKEHLIKNKEKFKNTNYLGFYGGKNAKPYTPNSLSNFAPAIFTVNIKGENYTFNCVEQFIMWYKAKKFNNEDIAEEIINTPYNPVRYKQLGRKVKNYDDEIWSSIREQVFKAGLTYKFKQNKAHFDYLMGTKGIILVECNPKDNLWGAGISIEESFDNPSIWKGQNKLGFLIMEVRKELAAENE